MFSWAADPAMPRNAGAEAGELRYVPSSVLPADGTRGLTMFDQPNGFLPVGVWGVNASGAVPTAYDGLLNDASVDFNSSLQMSPFQSGAGSAKSKKDDASWLKRNGFATPADVSAKAMRSQIEAAERQLSGRPETSLAIVLASDWRDVGDHLAKHPAKHALVADAVANALPAMRFNKDPATLESAILAEVREAIRGATGVQAAFNQGESAAAIETGDKGSIKRVATHDLRLLPTLQFVAKLARDLGLHVTKDTQFVVGQAALPAPSAKALGAFIEDVIKRASKASPKPTKASPKPKNKKRV